MGKGATECVVPKGNMHRTKLDRIRHANLTGKNSIQGKRFFFADCGSEHIRRARCGKSARRDLSGGRWVTGVPTAIKIRNQLQKFGDPNKFRLNKTLDMSVVTVAQKP